MDSSSSVQLCINNQLPNLQLFTTNAIDQSSDSQETITLHIGNLFDLTPLSSDPKIQAQFAQFQFQLSALILEIPSLRAHQPKKSKIIKRLKRVRGSKRQSCVVCQQKCKAGVPVVQLECKHTYHEGCISKWLSKNSSCPLCRGEVE